MLFRIGLGALGAVALYAGLGCSPISVRQARNWEAGGFVRPDPADSAVTVAIERDTEHLPDSARRAVEAALLMLGTPQSTLDCSSFTSRAWAAAGVSLPRTVREQWQIGVAVEAADLVPGDLVFFAFERRPADHVGLYMGHDTVAHVSSAQGRVALASLRSAPFAAACVGARRPATPVEPTGD
jgi:cell wall-associated NlpC family hydrolase